MAYVLNSGNITFKRNNDSIIGVGNWYLDIDIWRKENNEWKLYGDQKRSWAGARSAHQVDPWDDRYFLFFSARSGCDDKEIASVNVTGPRIDEIPLTYYGDFGDFAGFANIMPTIGDVYSFHIVYNDSYTEIINNSVTGIIESGPNITYPQHNSVINETKPVFTWTDASSAVDNKGFYWIKVTNATDRKLWVIDLPLTDLSVRYNIDGTAKEPLKPGNSYWLEVFIMDAHNNYAYSRIHFNVSKTRTININLKKGWNLISIPLNLTNNTLPAPLKSIEGNYSKIFTYIDGKWIELKNNDKINETLGLWINMLKNDSLELEGTEIENSILNLNKGWNLMGYPYLKPKNISKFFDNVTVYMYNNSKWYSYNSQKPSQLNTLNKFIAGFGYWINVR